MLYILIHFVFVVIINCFLCDEIIFNKILLNNAHQTYVKGIIGTGSISQLIRIDIQKSFSFVFSNKIYSYNKSSIYSTNGIIRNYSKDLNGIESQDILEISNMKMTNFIFIYQTEVKLFQSEKTPFLGFGKGEQSLINQLYNNNLINYKNFGFFSEENNSKNLKMFIGRKLNDNPKYKCKMLKDISEGYSCILSSIGPLSNTADLKIKINKNVIFDTLTSSILFPYKYLSEFQKSYFTDKFFDENCKIIDDYFWYYIYCKKDKIKELPDLLLIFGDIYVLIPPIKLFGEIHEELKMKSFKIEFYAMSHFKEIYFGGWFVEQNLLTFDLDNENIIFQGHNFQIFTDFSNISSYSEIKLLIILCIYSLTFGIFYIVFKEKINEFINIFLISK